MQKIYSTVYVACEENMGETRFIDSLKVWRLLIYHWIVIDA